MLAIASNTFDEPSQTFIRAHVTHIAPGRTVLICREDGGAAQFGCPVLSDVAPRPQPQHLSERIANGLRHRWNNYVDPAAAGRDEARMRAFLQRHGVTAVMAEFGPNGALLRRACMRAKVSLYVHFHGFDATKLARSAHWRRHYRRLFRDATGVIVPSDFLAGRLRDLGCPQDKLHLSPNGIDSSLFRLGERSPHRIITVSRLVPVKGPLQTIEAFARVHQRFPNAHLDVVGDGALLDECMSLANNLGLRDAITFHGAKPASFVADLMAQSGIYAQHSVTTEDGQTEAFGIAPLEAGACGLPVVATRSGGITETVADGETGLLVEEHDVDGMAAAMLSLLNDPERAEAMGRAGRARVEARFTHERTAVRLREIMGLTC